MGDLTGVAVDMVPVERGGVIGEVFGNMNDIVFILEAVKGKNRAAAGFWITSIRGGEGGQPGDHFRLIFDQIDGLGNSERV